MMGLQTSGTATWLLLICHAVVWACPAMSGKDEVSIRGKLDAKKHPSVLLQEGDKEIRLTSDDTPVAETLNDPRLSGREVKVVGQFRKDGSFEVNEFFIVRPDALYRVIYFCRICNITTFSPGNCVCCQAPTEPVEVPPTDPRIYHEEIKSPAIKEKPPK